MVLEVHRVRAAFADDETGLRVGDEDDALAPRRVVRADRNRDDAAAAGAGARG
jgi:hypothetical protein